MAMLSFGRQIWQLADPAKPHHHAVRVAKTGAAGVAQQVFGALLGNLVVPIHGATDLDVDADALQMCARGSDRPGGRDAPAAGAAILASAATQQTTTSADPVTRRRRVSNRPMTGLL